MLHRFTVRLNSVFASGLTLASLSGLDRFLQDTRLNYKIHYIAISASNFASDHNIKTFCLIDYKKDLKYKALNENLLKVRDKYGVDIIRYASEELNG